MTSKIAIQGFEGSFHEMAARKYWGDHVAMQYCASFREVVQKAADPGIGAALMAIENTIAGSILPNYSLLRESKLQVVGEVNLHIRQHLLVYPGVTLEDIREVHSHPMAILQCLDFLQAYDWKLVETEDTALSALRICQQKSKHTAAIASSLAAELFGLHQLVQDIHDAAHNYTRFLVLAPDPAPVPGADKALVCFQIDSESGRLAMVLQTIAGHGIHLGAVQSMPIAGNNWKYRYYIDVEFDDLSIFEQMLARMRLYTQEVIIMGKYKKATRQTAGRPEVAKMITR